MTPFNAFHRSFALPHLDILFAPFHGIVAPRAEMLITKANRSNLVRYFVSKSHGSEACNCRVQRDLDRSGLMEVKSQDQ